MDDLEEVAGTALALGASSRLCVFASFGSVSPPWPAARDFAPGASSSVSSVSGVAGALAAGASVTWWAGGGPSVPLAVRLASRSAALVSAVASSGAGRGFVGFVTSPCPAGLGTSSFPSACFSGSGSGSWASLALASGLGLPIVVFAVGALASQRGARARGGGAAVASPSVPAGLEFLTPHSLVDHRRRDQPWDRSSKCLHFPQRRFH